MLERKDWPQALKTFLASCSTQTTIDEIAVCALRSPSGFPTDGATSAWLKASLAALRWKEGKGAVWRRTAA